MLDEAFSLVACCALRSRRKYSHSDCSNDASTYRLPPAQHLARGHSRREAAAAAKAGAAAIPGGDPAALLVAAGAPAGCASGSPPAHEVTEAEDEIALSSRRAVEGCSIHELDAVGLLSLAALHWRH